jgi:hypothetical protein
LTAVASTAAAAPGRNVVGTPIVRSLEVSQFGATFGQSIGNHLVVASTVKVLHASSASIDSESEGGLDIGAMAMFRPWRAGIMVRNAKEPTFGEGDTEFTLRRQVRAGVAWSSAASTAYGGASIAFDADLRELPTALGDERRIAVGGELWTKKRLFGGRAGISRSTVGEHRTAYSGGASVALRTGVFGEAQLTGGSDELRKGWSLGLRLTF